MSSLFTTRMIIPEVERNLIEIVIPVNYNDRKHKAE